MRASIFFPALFIALSFVSCVNLPDINPQTSENLIVQDVDVNGFFSEYQHFNKPMDINGNGTVDFYFKGNRTTYENIGTLFSVTLVGAIPENKTIAQTLTDRVICTSELPNKPISALTSNFLVSPLSKWQTGVVFYEYQEAPNGCTGYNKHIEYNKAQYLGVKFKEDDQVHFGWIRITAEDMSQAGFVDCADVYRIDQAAYNQVAGQSIRIPS